LREIDQSLYVVPCRWNIMPTGESISEVFVLKNPPTLVVRSVRGISMLEPKTTPKPYCWSSYVEFFVILSLWTVPACGKAICGLS
ncbi:MAG: hypothetical protein WA125_01525, partial [Desulfosporosinus sp.]